MRTDVLYSLRFKMMAVVIAMLVTLTAALFVVFFVVHRRQLMDDLARSMDRLNAVVESSLELAMMTNQPDRLQAMLVNIARGEAADRLSIVRPGGMVWLSSEQREVGRFIDRTERGCVECHGPKGTIERTAVMFTKSDGEQVFRSANPIENRPPCHRCHDPERRVNGMLIMDYPVDWVRRRVRAELWSDIRGFAPALLTALIGAMGIIGLIMHRMVASRLSRFVRASRSVGSGNLAERVSVSGRDEITQLGTAFNEMAVSLERSVQEVREGKAYLERLMEGIDDGILVIDPSYTVMLANRAALANCRWTTTQIVGMKCYEATCHLREPPCHDAQASCPVREAMETGQLATSIHVCPDGDGRKRYVEIYASPIKNEAGQVVQVVEVRRDITERRHLEAQLARSDRLASVGRLAAGVAHEINNPMASITACVEGLQRRLHRVEGEGFEGLETLQEYLTIIGESAYRCKAITEKLLQFARKSDPEPKSVDVHELIEGVMALVAYEADREGKTILKRFGEVSSVVVDRAQLSQALLNILLNGLDAVDRGGTVEVCTRERDGRVEIAFRDDGCGIAKEHMDPIFEPFFTTKPEGEGTGLGLSICDTLIKQQGGSMYVESELGRGSVFTVILPIVRGDPL